MRVRRGILLAAIHLTVTAALLVWGEAYAWRYISAETITTPVRDTAYQEADGTWTVSFNPCNLGGIVDGPGSVHAAVSSFDNVPAALISGWHMPCTTQGRFGEFIEKRMGRTHRSETAILCILCLLAAVQWFFLGAFPLIEPKRWWQEPCMLLTLGVIPVAITTGIRPERWIVNLYVLFAFGIWLWWFWLLLTAGCRAGWRLALRLRQPAA